MKNRWQPAWQRWQQQRPRLHRDGFSLPATVLLRALQKELDGEQYQVKALLLAPDACLLRLNISQPTASMLDIHFRITPLCANSHTLHVPYHLHGRCHDASLLRRSLGKLLWLAIHHGQNSQLLQTLAADLDFIDIYPDHLLVHLDRIPLLQRSLLHPAITPLFSLKQITTPPGYLRLQFGTIQQG